MKCITCGNFEFKDEVAYNYKSENFQAHFPGISIWTCTICGTAQCNHDDLDANALNAYYKNNYRKDAVKNTPKKEGARKYFIERANDLLFLTELYLQKNKINGGPLRIFEVGAGFGYNIKAFANKYPTAYVATDEPDKNAIEMMGMERLQNDKIENGPWDIIIISHVLEHLLYPDVFLKNTVSLLKKNGLLVIEVPNDPMVILNKQEHEPHITFYTEKSLKTSLSTNCPNGDVLICGTAGPLLFKGKLGKYWKRKKDRMIVRIAILNGYISILPFISKIIGRRGVLGNSNHTILDFNCAERRWIRLIYRRK